MQTLVLIDAGLPDLAALLVGLRPGCQAVPVAPEQDALEVLAAAVTPRRSPGDWRLAVVAHGAPGMVFIGREPLTAAAIERRSAAWRQLSPGAIDLYSCRTGEDRGLLEALAAVIDAPVRGSAQAIGHRDLGGSWLLDPEPRTAGNAIAPFHARNLAAWRHTLATLTVGPGQTYTTIQAAIDAAAAGDIVEVLPGTYAENILINKSLTLRGAQDGVKATGAIRDGGESIISGTGGSSSYVVTIEANNVTVDGFKIEINGSARDGINTRVLSTATKPGNPALAYRSGITLTNNWIQHSSERTNQVNGIVFGESTDNATKAVSAEIADVLIKDNYLNLTTSSSHATPASTSITGARGIVLTNMFRNSGASLDYTNLDIKDNTIFATYQTLLQAQLQTRLVGAEISGNTIGNSRSGPSLPTLVAGSSFSNNTIQNINPQSDYYSNLAGAYLGVVDSTVANNSFTNIGGSAGLVLAGGRSADPTFFPASGNSNVSGNTFTYNNQAVSPLAASTAAILLEGNTSATATNVNGWLTGRQPGTTGAQAGSLTLSGNSFTNGAVNPTLPAVAIAQESVGTTLNLVQATPNSFGGVALDGATTNDQLFAIADAVADRVDASTLGVVTLRAGQVFITPNSVWSPAATTTASVQRAVDAAAAGNTVWIQPGSYAAGNATTGVESLTLQIPAGVSGFTGLALGTGISGATLAGPGAAQLIGNSGDNSFTVSLQALASATSIAGGSGTDSLQLASAASLSDASFSPLSSLEVLRLADGGNSLSLGTAFAASGVSTIVGGSGTDSLAFSGNNTLTLSSSGALGVNNVSLSSIEQVDLGAGSNTLLGSSAADALTINGAGSGLAGSAAASFSGVSSVDLLGGADSVTLSGSGSMASLSGGAGSDSLSLSRSITADSVTISGAGAGSIDGGTGFNGFEQLLLLDGDDTVLLNAAGSSTISLAGGAGSDTLRISASDAAGHQLSITGSSGGVQGSLDAVSLTGFESIGLGSGNDSLSLGLSQLNGLAANASVDGGGGNDQLLLTSAGTIADAAFSSLSGIELIRLADGGNSLTLATHAQAAGIATVVGGGGNDRLAMGADVFGSIDSLAGGGGTDTLALTSAGSISDASFASTSSIEVLQLADGANSLSLAANAQAAGLVSIAGGSGGDSIRLALDSLPGFASVAGGGGTDTLALASAGSITDASFANLSSLEVLQLADGANTVSLAAAARAAGLASLIGGSGADSIDLSSYSPAPDLALGDGSDTVVVAGSFDLSDHSGIEVLQLNSSSGASLVGDAAANQLFGNSGNDTLDGGAGNDTLDGGAGNDLYLTDSSNDQVLEAADGGSDTVQSAVGYALPAEVETLVLTGSDDINGIGNSLANLILGNSGNNILDGLGGFDTMVGGAGNDYYGVNSSADVVTELSGEGDDTIFSGVSLSLPAQVETLVLSGLGNISAVNASSDVVTTGTHALNNGDAITVSSNRGALQANTPYYLVNATSTSFQLASSAGGTPLDLAGSETGLYTVVYTTGSGYNLSATGNSLDNLLVGNAGANLFNSSFSGGGGDDTMQGGAGNDFYYFDSAGDTAIEASGEAAGTDVVFSSVDVEYLPDNVENLELVGTANLRATGNGSANIIIGNAGNNTIDGGRGSDSLAGGAGNDLYLLDVQEDFVEELSNGGNDTIQVRESYTAPLNVERVELSGSGRHNLTGNSQANILVGNQSANSLDGGAGNDTLEGLGGNDAYRVDASGDLVIEASGAGRDSITSSVSYTLPSNVETLELIGSANLNATGNSEANTLIGNDGANSLDGGAGADRLLGGAGNDSYAIDNPDDEVLELPGGGSDTLYASIALDELPAEVEAVVLTGTGDLAIRGNGADNLLVGNAGANTIDGGAGNDTLQGGAGNDLYRVDASGDLVIEASGGGTDTISTSVSLTSLPEHVEVLVAAGRSALLLSGNSLANSLVGGRGADTLDGGGGNDTMTGLGGNDTYLVESSGDRVEEGGSPLDGRNDVVIASTSISALAANVETLILTGSAHLSGTGNSGRNTISGNSGNNTLDGGGGRDQLLGGAGNDFYLVDSSDDRVTELAGEGIDTISASISIEALPDQVEVLVLSGSGDLQASGNGAANTLIGNSGANRLDGGGGGDTLIGGAGNDHYSVDSADDLVIELAGGGTDTISTSVSLTALPEHVEVASLNSSASLALVGNSLANLLVGNRGSDTLNGGAGADTLDGGRGNDLYVLDQSGDVVIEAPRAGTDSVLSSISTTLGDNVEDLTLVDAGGAINAVGNSERNTLRGNASANLLLGLGGSDSLSGGGGDDTLDGGAGNDWLSGGSGADLFRFSSSDDIGRYSKVDSISDFNPAEGDRIDLSAIASSLGRSLTWMGTSSYSGSAGQVRYDSDGGVVGLDLTGNGRNTTSIRVTPGLALTSGQFILG